jgi:hypothetical protein
MLEQSNAALRRKPNLQTVGLWLWRALPWLFLIMGYLFSVAFMAKYGRSYLDSDMASEMVLADLLNKDGGLLSTNWFYSTELRVAYVQMAFRLGLLIFPANWHAARVFSVAVLMAALAAVYLFFAFSAGFRRLGVWSCAALMWPFGYWYLFLSSFGSYYIPHMIFVMLPLALALRWAKNGGRWQQWLDMLLLIAVSFVGGLNGVRMLMNCFLPFALAASVLLGLRIYEKPLTLRNGQAKELRELRLFLAAFFASLAGLAGYLVNDKILSQTHYFRRFTERAWGKMDAPGWLAAMGDFFSLFGYQDGIPLFSVSGVCVAFGLVTAAAIACSAVRLLLRWKTLSFGQQAVVAFFWSTLVLDGAIYAFTSGAQGYNNSYWLPVVPLGFAVLQAEGETEEFRVPSLRRLAAVAFAACILLTSIGSVKYFLDVPLRAVSGMEEVSQWLVDNGYTEGYGTFWNCNVVTELTSGRVEMWNVKDLPSMEVNPWLQQRNHDTEMPKGRTFVLVGPVDNVADTAYLPYGQADHANVVYSEHGFSVIEIDDAQQIYDAVAAAQAAQAAAEAAAAQ